MGGIVIILALVVVVMIILLGMAIRIVRDYQRLVVFRLGRCIGEKGPGFIILIPFVDKATLVDQRELFLDVPQQTCITRDNAPVSIDFLTYMKVTNPTDSVLNVANWIGASQGIATTTLRAVIGDIMLDEVLARREQINQVLRAKLDEVTERWGVKVTSVEVREIIPPRDIQEAMSRQMSAERSRRATVTEADGKREAAIKVAEGEKQAAILEAEGARQAAILRAEGFALALDKIFAIAKTVDSKTLSLQYLETLKSLGSSPATKFVLPMEFTNLLRPFVGITGAALNQEQQGQTKE